MNFRELKKLQTQDTTGLPVVRLALASDTTTHYLATALAGTAIHAGLALALYEPGFAQLEAELLVENSALYAFGPAYVVIHLASEKLLERFFATPLAERERFAEQQLARCEALWAQAARHAKVIFCGFWEVPDGVYGNYAGKTAGSFRYQLARLNLLLLEAAQRTPGLLLCDLGLVQARLGRERCFDPKLYYAAGVVISLAALPAVAHELVAMIRAAEGRGHKCLVLDLDNTLWGGIIGEDGLDKLQLGEVGAGKAFVALQAWVKQLQQRGVLLAVVSKNDEATAKEPFERHPDMVLALSDFAVFLANWETKVDNLKALQQTLDIGLDALVFVDDNPFERQMVRELLPAVCVPELPEDPTLVLDFLIGANLFEAAGVSAEDGDRTRYYQLEQARRAFETAVPTLDAYLMGLGMTAEVAPFTPYTLPRVAQLTQRSNQFNLRTVRYGEAELERLLHSPRHTTRTFTLSDRFGPHGLVGVVVLEALDADTLFIDTWLMSCRVLKRGLESFMLSELVDIARSGGHGRLVGEYLPTAKNGLVATLLADSGFRLSGTRWVLAVANWTPPAHPIRKALPHDLG